MIILEKHKFFVCDEIDKALRQSCWYRGGKYEVYLSIFNKDLCGKIVVRI